MQIKNSRIINIIIFFVLMTFSLNLDAEEFNITAKEILIDKENQTLIGNGNVKAVDSDGNIINANKITYEKSREFLLAEGLVKITDQDGNILETEKATFDKLKEIIIAYDNTKLIMKDEYQLISKNILYDSGKKILSSNKKTILSDKDGNIIETNMFQFDIKNNLFSSIGKIKVIDIKKNKYFFKELYVDTKNKKMVGSDVSVILDQESFGVSKESDPRFVANDIFVSKNKIDLSKGVFTVCKKRDGKCPPWSLKAKKITHDKTKKTIYYEHATLKVYDMPIFYFPKFFHPDPTVKRQSGFLSPFFTNSTAVGAGFALPYYWAISDDKDLTFTSKTYTKENILLLNEYRQAFKNGFLTLDTSYTEGYNNTSSTKTEGSRNHLFANLNLNLNEDASYESNLSLKVQKTSNNTYFRVHDINTSLVNSENTTLENEINYSFSKDDMYFNINANIYENLREKNNSDKYEYILPSITYGKTFLSDKIGTLDLKSNVLYSNYETNKHKTLLVNDLMWKPFTRFTKNGFVNSVEGMLRNTNYKVKKTDNYRDEGTINEINGALAFKTSLPMKKEGINFSNLFSPNLMLRYSPGKTRNLSDRDVTLNYTNLYLLNKTSEIEEGVSAIVGFDFKINEQNQEKTNKEKISLSMGQVINYKENDDLPSKSSLDQKTSDLVGEFNYNFSEIGKINYKFSVDHNLSDVNYSEVSTKLDFGKFQFNLDFLEQKNHIGEEHYASSGISLNLNDRNKLSLSTKKNFKTESTELYDISYQYAIDCLTAGLVYRREFYQDADDIEANDSLMFTITFVPFAGLNAPLINK